MVVLGNLHRCRPRVSYPRSIPGERTCASSRMAPTLSTPAKLCHRAAQSIVRALANAGYSFSINVVETYGAMYCAAAGETAQISSSRELSTSIPQAFRFRDGSFAAQAFLSRPVKYPVKCIAGWPKGNDWELWPA